MNAVNALRSVRSWFSDNLLTDQPKQYMPFSQKPNTSRPTDTLLLKVHAANCSDNSSATMCNCPLLRTTNTVRCLSVLIDMSLNWKLHLDSLTARARKLVFIFEITAQRHYHFTGSHLYNKINKICYIFPLPLHLCKEKVSLFLRAQDYNETESALVRCKTDKFKLIYYMRQYNICFHLMRF